MTGFIRGKYFLAFCIAYCLLLTILPQKVQAKEIGIRVTPSVIEINPQKDGVIEKSISVENTGNDSLALQVGIKAFTTDKEGNISYPADESLDTDTRELVRENTKILENGIQVTSLTLAPGQKQILTLQINIKDIQKVSQYTLSVFFVSEPDENFSSDISAESPLQTELNLSAGTVTHVLILGLKNQTQSAIGISSFQTDHFIQKGPVYFHGQIKNLTNKYINIYGYITITNMFNQQVGLIRIPNQLVFAGSEKELLGPGGSGLSSSLSWSDSVLLGWYKAALTISTNDGYEVSKNVSFIAFPFKTVLLILIALLIASFVISQVRERVR